VWHLLFSIVNSSPYLSFSELWFVPWNVSGAITEPGQGISTSTEAGRCDVTQMGLQNLIASWRNENRGWEDAIVEGDLIRRGRSTYNSIHYKKSHYTPKGYKTRQALYKAISAYVQHIILSYNRTYFLGLQTAINFWNKAANMADVETQRSFNTSQKSGATGFAKKKISEAQEQASSQIDDAESRAGTDSVGGESQAIPAGSVDHDGNVVSNDEKMIGKVTGKNASQFQGSIVDQDGDVLDDEGNVIASAEPQEANGGEKPEQSDPFGVQDNGEITNASGVPVGKLVEGEPQDLVGTSIKEIDEDGNLKAKSGSTVGKAELNPEVLGQGGDAAGGAASGIKVRLCLKEVL
jgi:hypothetical protein